jgi:putative FmdB family regulatory protein
MLPLQERVSTEREEVMPVYTYQCTQCGVRFEVKQSFNDAPITVCPECRGAARKVIGPVGVIFKGSGFYVTDSRANHSNLTGSPKKDSESSSASSSPSAETKADSTSSSD